MVNCSKYTFPRHLNEQCGRDYRFRFDKHKAPIKFHRAIVLGHHHQPASPAPAHENLDMNSQAHTIDELTTQRPTARMVSSTAWLEMDLISSSTLLALLNGRE